MPNVRQVCQKVTFSFHRSVLKPLVFGMTEKVFSLQGNNFMAHGHLLGDNFNR